MPSYGPACRGCSAEDCPCCEVYLEWKADQDHQPDPYDWIDEEYFEGDPEDDGDPDWEDEEIEDRHGDMDPEAVEDYDSLRDEIGLEMRDER